MTGLISDKDSILQMSDLNPLNKFSGSIRPVAYSDSKKIGHLPLIDFIATFSPTECRNARKMPDQHGSLTPNEIHRVYDCKERILREYDSHVRKVRHRDSVIRA